MADVRLWPLDRATDTPRTAPIGAHSCEPSAQSEATTMLLQTMKKHLMEAMKAGRVVEKEILKVAIGEIEVADARGTVKTEADQIAIVRKLVKSNEETLSSTTDPDARKQLEAENAVLKVLLPQTLSVDAISALLEPVRDAIRAAANDGQATGVAMKHLKSTQSVEVSGKDVTEAVKKLRA